MYKLDESERLIILDKLHTYGTIEDHDKPDDIKYRYAKDVNGEEVSITEQEYLALMRKYGSVGYLDTTGNLKAKKIVINPWELLTEFE